MLTDPYKTVTVTTPVQIVHVDGNSISVINLPASVEPGDHLLFSRYSLAEEGLSHPLAFGYDGDHVYCATNAFSYRVVEVHDFGLIDLEHFPGVLVDELETPPDVHDLPPA
jgi:hypothetical protein